MNGSAIVGVVGPGERCNGLDDGVMTAGDAHERPKKAEIFPEERGGVECGDRGFELAGMADLPRRGESACMRAARHKSRHKSGTAQERYGTARKRHSTAQDRHSTARDRHSTA